MSTSNSTQRRERGIILTRVSDPKQSGGAVQLENCRRLARQHDVLVVAEIDDDGVSGDDMERPGIIAMLATLEKAHRQRDPITWIITDQSDRVFRANSLPSFEVLAKSWRFGVRKLLTPGRLFDLCSALDRTMLQIEIDHKNNPYLKDLGRRALGGMLEIAKLGYWTGQKEPLGYKVVKVPGEWAGRRRESGRLAIDPDTAPLIVEMFELYRDGLSTADLAVWLGRRLGRTYCPMAIRRMLRNELYTGTRVFGGRPVGRHAGLIDGAAAILPEGSDGSERDAVRITGVYPAIISQGLFDAVQRRLAKAKRGGRKKHWTNKAKGQAACPTAPLSGLCCCGVCGEVLQSCRVHPYHYMVCKQAHELGLDACPGGRRYRAGELLARVKATLAENLLQGDAVARLVELAGQAEGEARREWEARLESARRAADTTAANLARARRRLATEPDDMLDHIRLAIRELTVELAAAESELARLRGEEPRPEESDAALLDRWLVSCRDVCEGTAPEEPEALNAILQELVAEVRVWPPEQRVRGKKTVGRIEVILPDWLSSTLGLMAGPGCSSWPRNCTAGTTPTARSGRRT
jgi:DNA invertase Pin-like site-specific DNA recombinase